MPCTEIETAAVDGQFPPPGLRGESGEGDQHGGGGGNAREQEESGKKGDAQDGFDPWKGISNGKGQSVGQHNLVRVDRRECLHRLTNFGESGREKKKSEQRTQGKTGGAFHRWEWR